jgi:hypothetical protein
MPDFIKHIYALFLTAAWVPASSQVSSTTTLTKPTPKLVSPTIKPIKSELSFGYRLHTDGWSLYADYGKIRSKNSKTQDIFWNAHIFQIELSEKKHPREEKISSQDASGNSTNYVYGKINNFYSLKAGWGVSKMLAGKPDPGSVSIHWVTIAGASLGMLKPYYLNLYSDPDAIKYGEDTRSRFLSQSRIIGSAGFSKGLGEMRFIPGGHIKSMLHFDFSSNKTSVVAVEAGGAVEYFGENVVMMVDQSANPYFVNFFLAFQFGKRW